MIALCQAPPHLVQSASNKAVQMSFEFKLPSRVLPSCSFALAGFFSSPLFSLSLISLVTSLLFLFQRSRFQAALEVLHFISPFARLHFFPLNYFQLELPSRLSSFHFICSLHLKLTSSTSRLSSFRSAFSSLQNISSELTLVRVHFLSLGTSLLTECHPNQAPNRPSPKVPCTSLFCTNSITSLIHSPPSFASGMCVGRTTPAISLLLLCTRVCVVV
jgi:hypothetical protein